MSLGMHPAIARLSSRSLLHRLRRSLSFKNKNPKRISTIKNRLSWAIASGLQRAQLPAVVLNWEIFSDEDDGCPLAHCVDWT